MFVNINKLPPTKFLGKTVYHYNRLMATHYFDPYLVSFPFKIHMIFYLLVQDIHLGGEFCTL